MNASLAVWPLALALLLAPRPAAAQCMGMSGGGGHEHGAAEGSGSEKKAQKSIRRLLSEERSRDLLLAAILDDAEFMRRLISSIAETLEWRALAVERLAGAASATTLADTLRREEPRPGATDAAAVYTCPMHPEVQSSRPGSCPKCGMALERSRQAGSR